MATRARTTFSAQDAKAHFGELLDTALNHPVGITKHERLTAYVISKFEFESMAERLQELEDQLWLLRAEAARQQGFVDSKTVKTLLRTLDDETTTNNKKRRQVLGKS